MGFYPIFIIFRPLKTRSRAINGLLPAAHGSDPDPIPKILVEPEVMKLLLDDARIDVNATDDLGHTALYHLFRGDFVVVVSLGRPTGLPHIRLWMSSN